MIYRGVLDNRVVVLLGENVAQAFDFKHAVFLTAVMKRIAAEYSRSEEGLVTTYFDACFAFFPHPSGVSTWWNQPGAIRRARKFLRDLEKL
jgi:hypothetical protein